MINEIMRELSDIRSRDSLRIAALRERAMADETYYLTEKRRRELQYLIAAEDNPQQIAALELEDAACVAAISQRLAQLGLDLSPRYECDICRDFGYVDGKRCECVTKRLVAALKTAMGIPVGVEPSFASCDLKVFGENAPRMEKIYALMRDGYCKKFPDTQKRTVIFTGSTGAGKTYLTCCVANDLLLRGHNVLYLTAYKLNDIFVRDNSDFERRGSLLDVLLGAECLIVDDLGTEPIFRNVSRNYLYSLLNERLLAKKHTIFTTNLTMPQLYERYGERIFSRLNNKESSVVLEIFGKDLRTTV